MRLFKICSLLLFINGTLGAQNLDVDLFRQAETQFTEKHWRTSQGLYKLFLEKNPLSALAPEGTFKLALSHYYLGQYRDALKLFDQAKSRYPSNTWSQALPFWQGLSFMGLQEWASAEVSLTTALELNDDPALRKQSLLSRAQAQVQLGRFPEAKNTLESLDKEFKEVLTSEGSIGGLYLYILNKLSLWPQTLAFDKTKTSSWSGEWRWKVDYWTAEALWQTGEKEKSLGTWEKLANLGPESAAAAFSRLFSWHQDKRDTKAMEALLARAETSLGSRPEILRDFWARLGLDLARSGQNAQALPWLEKAWAGGKEGLAPGVILALSQSQEKGGNTSRAMEIIDTGLKSVKGGEELLQLQLGRLALKNGQWDTALGAFRAALKASPQGSSASWALYSQAWVQVKTGKYREAVQSLKTEPSPLKTEALKTQSWRLKAMAEGRSGSGAESLLSLETYLALVPTDVGAIKDLASLYYEKKDYGQVITLLKSAESKVPTMKTTAPVQARSLYLIAGLSFLGLGKNLEAQGALKTASGLGSDGETAGPITYFLGSTQMKNSPPDWKGAITTFESGLKSKIPEPWLSRIWYAQGLAALSAGEPALAEVPLKKLSETGTPKLLVDQGKNALARSLTAQNKIPQAVAVYQGLGRSPEAGDQGAAALMDAARLIEGYGSSAQVLESYDEVARRYPGTKTADEALFRRGEYLVEKKDSPGALNAFKKYLQDLPRGALRDEAFYRAGSIAQTLADSGGAIFYWTSLVKDYPQSQRRSGVLWELTTLYLNTKRYAEAAGFVNTLVTDYPKEASAMGADWVKEELGYITTGKTPEEAKWLVTIKKDKRTATASGREAMLALAQLTISGDSRRKDEGLPLVEEILAQVKDNPSVQAQAQFLLGEYWRKSGDLSRAATEYLKVLALKSPNKDLTAQALYKSMDTLLLGGNKQQASTVLAALEKNFPGTTWAIEARKLLEAQK